MAQMIADYYNVLKHEVYVSLQSCYLFCSNSIISIKSES